MAFVSRLLLISFSPFLSSASSPFTSFYCLSTSFTISALSSHFMYVTPSARFLKNYYCFMLVYFLLIFTALFVMIFFWCVYLIYHTFFLFLYCFPLPFLVIFLYRCCASSFFILTPPGMNRVLGTNYLWKIVERKETIFQATGNSP